LTRNDTNFFIKSPKVIGTTTDRYSMSNRGHKMRKIEIKTKELAGDIQAKVDSLGLILVATIVKQDSVVLIVKEA